jgi:hypothetical protein
MLILVIDIKTHDLLEVDVPEDATVGLLKSELARTAGVILEGMRVIVDRKFCSDSQTLAALGLSNSSVVKAYIKEPDVSKAEPSSRPIGPVIRKSHRISFPEISPEWRSYFDRFRGHPVMPDFWHHDCGGLDPYALAALWFDRKLNSHQFNLEIASGRFTKDVSEDIAAFMRVSVPQSTELEELLADCPRKPFSGYYA